MLKVVAFMKQVAKGLQMEGNFGTAHVYRSSLNAIIAYRGKGDFTFHEVTPEWLKGLRDSPSWPGMQLEYCIYLFTHISCGL